MENISWTDCVRNEEVLHRVKKDRNILHTTKRMKAYWIGHILRRNYPLKHDSEGLIKASKGQGRRCKQLLGDSMKTRR
jgi:hypothetical protein